jgi:heat shock protein HslJ
LLPAFASGEQPPLPLCKTIWRSTTIEGNLVKGRAPTLTINGDRASGSGGCNRYFSSVELGKENAIHFGTVASTRMACQGVEGVQETAYFKALFSVTSYHLNNDYLVLIDSKFNKLVEFSAKPIR